MTDDENGQVVEEKIPVLPIDIAGTLEGAKKTAAEDAPKERGALSKIASALISFLFCGVTLLYMITQTVESADRLFSDGADSVLLGEVFGDTQTEAESGESAASPPEEPEREEPNVSPPSAAKYPIVYESLANTDLLADMSNETAYEPDMAYLLEKEYGVGRCREIYDKYGADAPVVLIVHTHGTEAYGGGEDTYTEDDSFRSSDTAQNVVAVGDVIASVLEERGVNVIHCREMFDEESYKEAYSRSYAAVSSYLEKYPSLFYVLDVHRDSIIRDDGTNVATYAEAGGKTLAQAMIVVGTDEGGADHETWEKNLSLALNIQSNTASLSESVPRKINLRSAAFNQGLSPGSLLLEIGSCVNTLDEAKRTAVIVAQAVACTVKGEDVTEDAEELLSER